MILTSIVKSRRSIGTSWGRSNGQGGSRNRVSIKKLGKENKGNLSILCSLEREWIKAWFRLLKLSKISISRLKIDNNLYLNLKISTSSDSHMFSRSQSL